MVVPTADLCYPPSNATSRALLLMPFGRPLINTYRSNIQRQTVPGAHSGPGKSEVYVHTSKARQTSLTCICRHVRILLCFCLVPDASLQKLATCSLSSTLPLVEGLIALHCPNCPLFCLATNGRRPWRSASVVYRPLFVGAHHSNQNVFSSDGSVCTCCI